MLLQVRNTFEEKRLVAKGNVVEQHQMLVNLSHISHVRYHRQAKSPRQHAYHDKFRDARNPGAIDLHNVDCLCLHEIVK